ncbi:hypothetical protein DJ252_23370 [Salmonella enterica subsp. enterica serovar Uzaramo]|uniref:Terminase n=1 Tax=Salmonella enterica TaxID=28901 RepID=A0A759WBT4_SALER|nr:hypothetical protein [Salmonella enterica]EEE9947873.1 hypothetical protein [Salmonella enterica subsp. enterica serovar Uzaramo]EIM5532937.1 hypothetical protein [Salmonella enterica subsp. enterica]EHP5749089.1 hypothetical protein [Salmonella enterica]EHP5915515.1 hypothetical protein [Salmonella enterica]
MATPDWEAIKAAYQSGVSARSLAARFGVSHTAINKRAKKEGWTVVSTEVSTQPKVSSGNQSGNHGKTSNRKALSKVSTRKKSENSPETKRIPGRPFTAHNTESLKHGAYARRLLLSDDVTIDTLNTELKGELFLVRAGNMLAVTNIGKWTAQMEDATPEEQKNLREQIAAAEKGIMRNIARIESLERSLGALAIMAVTPAKIVADTAYKEAVTAKLTAENQGITTPLTEAIDELQSLNKGGKL